jgi:hypothetical protein
MIGDIFLIVVSFPDKFIDRFLIESVLLYQRWNLLGLLGWLLQQSRGYVKVTEKALLKFLNAFVHLKILIMFSCCFRKQEPMVSTPVAKIKKEITS